MMMKKLKVIILITTIFFFVCFIILNTLVGLGQKNFLFPYIDTKFSSKFDETQFNQIESGMTFEQVHFLIGEPLVFDDLIDGNGFNNKFIHKDCRFSEDYSQDGKYTLADYAWRSFSVYYSSDSLVVAKRAIWYYD